ncbi:MAG: hypothetical protein JXB62_01085 [Pirellulales bacterium]|nr:hypothetical protein [Pirellulales bacterium]
MFGRLAAVRMKTAEDAFAKGRLDEAFEIASAGDLAGNRRVQQLLQKLAEPLLHRGQDHLLSRRFAEALADFDRAARCGYQTNKINEWRRRAAEVMEDDQKAEHERRAALAVARERLAAGSLNGAADALAKAPEDDPDRAAVSEQIARQAGRAKEALVAAKDALKRGHVARAVERLRVARALHCKLDEITEMEATLVEHALKQATEDFRNGRLNRVGQHLAVLGEVGRKRPERVEMEEALRLAREAAKALADDRYAKAAVLLGRLAQVGPKAGWVSDVRKHLGVLEEHRRALLEGPLGLILGLDVPSAVAAKSTAGGRAGAPGLGRAVPPVDDERLATAETLPAETTEMTDGVQPACRAGARWPRPDVLGPEAQNARHHGFLPRRLLLRIDGAGSFLLLRGDRVGIGRSGPGATADLQLISDLSERQAEIIRAGEDYFVVARSGVELAGRQVDHALLQDGDRVRLGKRIRLKFGRPSLKSTTAVLDLGDGVRTTTDCRRVILWSGPLLMGGTRECHIKLGPGIGGAILMERGGGLSVKSMAPGGPTTPVPLGVQTELGELRMTVQGWSGDSQVGKVIG